MIKKFIKNIPFLFSIIKIITDRRYFYHYIQGFIEKRNNRNILALIESKIFGKKSYNINYDTNHFAKYLELKSSGYLVNPLEINIEKVNYITEFLNGCKCYDPDNNLKNIDPLQPSLITTRAFYDNADITRAPGVLKLANDENILRIAEEYFGAIPKIDSIWAWWTFPNDNIPPTQSFHRDMDTLNFLKFFVYLTDVDENSGPHVLVKGSHNSSFNAAKDKMYSDSEILKLFSENDIVEITGKSGHCFLADLFALHKGKNAIESPRLVLQIIYSIIQTPFGPKKPYIKLDEAKNLLNKDYSKYTNSNIIIN